MLPPKLRSIPPNTKRAGGQSWKKFRMEIIVLRAFSALKHWDESGFHQDASFYYFTGLANLHGAILALDGTQK
jgi:hypothetical protein